MPVYKDPAEPVSSAVGGKVESIQVSNGGVPKRAVSGRVEVTSEGVVGDQQRNRRLHGGPDRAVCLLSLEQIDQLRQEGHPIQPGTTGENLTISGVEWTRVVPGAVLNIGDVSIEITSPAHPCRNIAASFRGGDISRLSAKLQPGTGRMYARVLKPGYIRSGDSVTLA